MTTTMSNDNHFHMTLPSNASMNICPTNTSAQYVTKLPKCIEMDGEWSISLKEISTPLSFVNIMLNTHTFQVKSTTEHVELSLPDNIYLSTLSIICVLNKLGRQYNPLFRLVAAKPSRRLQLTVGEMNVFRPDLQLSSLLGLRSTVRSY